MWRSAIPGPKGERLSAWVGTVKSLTRNQWLHCVYIVSRL